MAFAQSYAISAYSVYIAIFVGVVVCPEIGYEAHP